MNKLILFCILFLTLAACGKANPDAACLPVPTQDLTKPGVLVIGDSISLGYTPFVQSDLRQVQVTHTFCNAESTTTGIHFIDWWLGYRSHWKVITFNHGLWNIPPGPEGTTIEKYAADLRVEGQKILQHADHVIFFTTTQVPPGYKPFSNDTVAAYNAAAVAVMSDLGIEVQDLNAVSATITQDHIDPENVHFIPAGYQILGQFVSDSISKDL